MIYAHREGGQSGWLRIFEYFHAGNGNLGRVKGKGGT